VKTAFATSILLLLCAASADAMIRRHDRPDSLYRADGADRTAVCRLGSGHGTLVGAKWVLTAAHVAQELTPGFDKCHFDGASYAIKARYMHPTWAGNLGAGFAEPEWVDMALVELEEPVKSIEPLPIHRQKNEVGERVRFVGSGKTGDGVQGIGLADGEWRGAYNVVEKTSAHNLVFLFDAPPAGEDLEGIAGPADSGSPALIRTKNGWTVIGVASYNDGPNIGMTECIYGTREVYPRTSHVTSWFDSVLAGKGTAWAETNVRTGSKSSTSVAVGDSAAFDHEGYLAVAREFVRTVNADDMESYRRLFTDAGWAEVIDWFHNGFANQRRRYGSIVRAYPPQKEPVRMGKFGWQGSWSEGANFVIIFEKGVGGALNIQLDDDGRIAHADVFIKEELVQYEETAPSQPFFGERPAQE
jgi:Trypsin